MNACVPAALIFVAATTLTLSEAGGEDPLKASPRKTRPSTDRTLRLPEEPYRYAGVDLPIHFKQPLAQRFDNTPSDNPITDHGATLGRVLFYDTRFSANNTIACGSCHVQRHAFADPNRFSRGFHAGLTDRHAMTIANVRYHPRARFFWDERGANLEEMVLMPVANSLEMGLKLDQLPAILGRDKRYPALFRQAFGDAAIDNQRISRALAQFLRAMVSYQAKYDQGRAAARSVSDDFANFTPQENRGKALFVRNCALCHLPDQEAHFIMVEPVNTGLDEDTEHADGGVGDITVNARDVGRFKSPSLRNVEVTGPYMHDGRFSTLDAVLEHYSSGGKKHPNKDVRIQPLRLTNSEKAALTAFLKTLTDRKFLEDPKFSDPFQ
jgi:cytochrome c peroxidase